MDSAGGPEAPDTGRETLEPEGYQGECEVCGHGMYGLHCKIICPNCGYRRDCSDP